MLRQRRLSGRQPPDAPWRVRLELQDARMDKLLVLVENDRVVSARRLRSRSPSSRRDAPTAARGDRSLRRDEVVVDAVEGLEPLTRQQRPVGALDKVSPRRDHAGLPSQPGRPAAAIGGTHAGPRGSPDRRRADLAGETDLVRTPTGPTGRRSPTGSTTAPSSSWRSICLPGRSCGRPRSPASRSSRSATRRGPSAGCSCRW